MLRQNDDKEAMKTSTSSLANIIHPFVNSRWHMNDVIFPFESLSIALNEMIRAVAVKTIAFFYFNPPSPPMYLTESITL